jgi:hypothetical protein
MIDNLKKILNEDQDPKAIEKISAKLENILMANEAVGYIAVQKKPAVTIFPDSIVVTNKRIILCKPKNLGLSMEFIDYDWTDLAGTFVKEGILGSDFTFTTLSDITQTVDYLPKNQARKLYTYAKEQLDKLKNPVIIPVVEPIDIQKPESHQEVVVEEVKPEEITHFAEIMPSNTDIIRDTEVEAPIVEEKGIAHLSQDELFAKLQNYKKLLDNGLILQGEYDKLKAEILRYL